MRWAMRRLRQNFTERLCTADRRFAVERSRMDPKALCPESDPDSESDSDPDSDSDSEFNSELCVLTYLSSFMSSARYGSLSHALNLLHTWIRFWMAISRSRLIY